MTEVQQLRSSRRAYLIVAGSCMLCGVISGMTINSMTVFIKPIANDLGVGYGQVAFYITIIYVVMTLCLSSFGRLIEKLDVRIMSLGATLLAGGSLASMSFLNNIYGFYAFGIVMGAANTFSLFLVGPILINRWFASRAGFWLGVVSAFSGAGSILFSPLGAWLTQSYGWRFTWRIFALIVLVVGSIASVNLRNRPSDVGAIPMGAAGSTSEAVIKPMEAPVGGTLEKSFWRRINKSALVLSVLFAFLLAVASSGTLHFYAEISGSFGLAPTVAAGAVSIMALGIMVGKPILGFISDRSVVLALTVAAICGIGAALCLLAFAGAVPMLTYVFGGVFGLCIACSIPMSSILVRHTFSDDDYSPIYAWVAGAVSLGSGFGATLSGAIRDFSGSLHPVLVMDVILIFVSWACACVVVKTNKK